MDLSRPANPLVQQPSAQVQLDAMFTSVILILCSALLTSADRSLSLKIVAPSATVIDVDNFHVATIVSNTGSETLRLLRDPRSPLSTMPTDTFRVVNSKGDRAEFSGIRVRYDPENDARSGRPESVVELNPGESITVEHDFAGAYNLSSTGAGAYIIDAANFFQVIETDNSLTALHAEVDRAEVTIQGTLVSTKKDGISLMKKRASYNRCSVRQQVEVTSAISAAQSYARESHAYLKLNPSGSVRYTRWFGTFGTGRYNKVLTSFSSLITSLDHWVYDCDTCSDPRLYAYVYPDKYGVVYLCGHFWNAPATGVGSKADTIIHEGTHFTKILGTRDYAYGQYECLDLAQSSPINAVYNADNHAFFSVNA
ncbi:unnamed protein product [Rhizoctonia solani]|uniref:Lysine-specific metallo-endopeptidase domain-containing protein n=1 Tax=Rhizoctonia solani TaxID=456999 RepID=A0A8H3BVD1_9AGAM|nr:unnamed protein product [Rhizoctonia solani]